MIVFIKPIKGQDNFYLFPDWMVDEFIEQDIPGVFILPYDMGEHTAEINGHSFIWYIEMDGTTRFRVPDVGVDFYGPNADYAEWVVTINWLGLFGSFPGGSITANSTIVGESIEDLSNVLRVSPGKTNNQLQSYEMGLEYESAEYYTQKIRGTTIPVNYTKIIDINRSFGITGRVNIASTGNASKTYIHLSPLYTMKLNENVDLGGLCNISVIKTSIKNFTVPTVKIFGLGGFAAYKKKIGKADGNLAILVEPKYNGSKLSMPIIVGLKGKLPVGKNSFYCEYITGTNPLSDLDGSHFSLLNFNFDILGLYSVGYKKNTGTDNYKNSIVYANFRKYF